MHQRVIGYNQHRRRRMSCKDVVLVAWRKVKLYFILFLFLCWHDAAMAQQPCRTMGGESDCRGEDDDEARCVWCPRSNACEDLENGCPGDVFNPSDCALQSQAPFCQAQPDCVWCPDKGLCRISAQGCPSEGPDVPVTPSRSPTRPPTRIPTRIPTRTPTRIPTRTPTTRPTKVPTRPPTTEPTVAPTRTPTTEPTNEPINEPTIAPTGTPTTQSTRTPTIAPTTTAPTTITTTTQPTDVPTTSPNELGPPTESPTSGPSLPPTIIPSTVPPTDRPTIRPTGTTTHPTEILTWTDPPASSAPSISPTYQSSSTTSSPTSQPMDANTVGPTNVTTDQSTNVPSNRPSTPSPPEDLFNFTYAPTEGNASGPDGDVTCTVLSTEKECLTTDSSSDCFWCRSQSTCRRGYAECPGNEDLPVRPNVCAQIHNASQCIVTSNDSEQRQNCTWCEGSSVCRAAEEECPGMGRSDPCRTRDDNVTCIDANDDSCTWFKAENRCVPSRGLDETHTVNGGNIFSQSPRHVCSASTNADDCTSNVACRLCPAQRLCRDASAACPDDGLGIRGDPCPQHQTEASCGTAEGCLWCLGSSTCRKAAHESVCDDDVQGDDDTGNRTDTEILSAICRAHTEAPECNVESDGVCRWCSAQSTCRPQELSCDIGNGNVEIEVDEGDRSIFTIQDDGLGYKDPNRVSVGLAYLYEINISGETIGSSIIDLTTQEYSLTQKVGPFLGNDGIDALQTSLRAEINDVGRIEMEIYKILMAGTIRCGNETWDVAEDDVKFNVILSEWRFCDTENSTCDTEKEVAYIDLALEIKGRLGSPQAIESNRLLLALGGNVPLLLSGQVDVDGMIVSMPAGFPRFETATNGTSDLLVFRFPRFNHRVKYDPIVPYHTATLVDLNDGSTEDDVQVTSAPTSLPTDSPTPSAPTEPVLVNDGSDGRSIPLIIGLVAGCLCLCLPSPFLLLFKLRQRRSNISSNSDEPIIREHDTNPEEGVWNDDDIIGDSHAQNASEESPEAKPRGPLEDSFTDALDTEEGSSEENILMHPKTKHSHDGYPMDDEEEFSKDESFRDEGGTDAEDTSTTSSKSRPRLLLSLRGFREAMAKTPSIPRRFSLKGFRDSIESSPPPPKLPPPRGTHEALLSPAENDETIISMHETQPGGTFKESRTEKTSNPQNLSHPTVSLALPHRLSLRGFEDEPIPTCPPMPRRVPRPSEDIV